MGNVYEYKRIVEDKLQCHVKYLDYNIIEPGRIPIPIAGTYWRPKIKSDHSMPGRESKETCILLYGRTNIGYTPVDLSIKLHAGSILRDQRLSNSSKTKKLNTEQTVHLDNILTLLQ